MPAGRGKIFIRFVEQSMRVNLELNSKNKLVTGTLACLNHRRDTTQEPSEDQEQQRANKMFTLQAA